MITKLTKSLHREMKQLAVGAYIVGALEYYMERHVI